MTSTKIYEFCDPLLPPSTKKEQDIYYLKTMESEETWQISKIRCGSHKSMVSMSMDIFQ